MVKNHAAAQESPALARFDDWLPASVSSRGLPPQTHWRGMAPDAWSRSACWEEASAGMGSAFKLAHHLSSSSSQ